jgi:quinol monooxygenase YgiN
MIGFSSIKKAATTTTTGRVKQRGEKAFVLAVELQFEAQEDADYVVEQWQVVTDYCFASEPFLYHYEISQSDQDPLKYFMYERYRSKEDYLSIHKTSEAFLKFRETLKSMQDSNKVAVSGHSYNELGVGFV